MTQKVGVENQPSRLPSRNAATAISQTREIGISHFQPKLMNWS